MDFRLLGPLEASSGTDELSLGSPKSRALLARLLIEPRRTVTVDRLVDDLWGEEVPDTAAKMVQIYVSQLRKALPRDLIVTRAPGYLADVPAEAVDVTRFKRLREEGRAALQAGDASTAAARLGEALSLWRGPALAEFTEPFAHAERMHLEDLRLTCIEDRIDADLALDRHADVVGELEALVTEHPLRENFYRQLMLALYRGGRQAEALAAYDRFRRRLASDLGIDPSPALKTLQFQILNQDPSLAAAEPEAVSVRRPLPAGLFGRATELARLEDALAAAERGEGSVIFMSGSAGIGKTRLAGELAERARSRGTTVLVGRCVQLVGAGVPFLPVIEAFRPMGVAESLAAGGSRIEVFEEVLKAIERLSAEGPALLVLEDAHWADESTLDLLGFLAYSFRSLRIVKLVTHRSDEVRFGDPLQRMKASLVSAGLASSLDLGPLDRDAIESLLAAGAAPPSPELTASIYERSSGNPFFAKELLAASARGEDELPAALRDVLLADVAELGPAGQAVCRAVAAAGRDVPYALLRASAALDESELADALRRAVDQHVLVPDQAAGTFRFRHPLFSEAVYATLLPGEREALHARIAQALSDYPKLAATGAAAAERAQHWAAAGRPTEALTSSLAAAREAEAVSGLAEALVHVERVLDLWDEVPDAEELSGVALPQVLAWATELAGMSIQGDDEVGSRLLLGSLGPDDAVEPQAVAMRLGVTTEAAERALETLERDGLVERVEAGFRSARIAMSEARRLFPAAVVLESVALRRAPCFDEASLELLRSTNRRLRDSQTNPAAAVAADYDFHRHLTARCGNEEILSALRPVKRALLRYERIYMTDADRIERSAEQHDAIIAALERRDHAHAAQLLRWNLTRGLPDLASALEP
jgi:DNA-binding SARP family transcriptional activator/DNA-binding GntR family transcriptional regulator